MHRRECGGGRRLSFGLNRPIYRAQYRYAARIAPYARRAYLKTRPTRLGIATIVSHGILRVQRL